MICAILFDLGGTLDSDGGHWLDRFVALYGDLGVNLPRETIRAAFDAAERRSQSDEAIASSHLREMVELHVGWQLAHIGLGDSGLHQKLVENFVRPMFATAEMNRPILAQLRSAGFRLGVVSNGCGNVAQLCSDFGYVPFLSAIVDSRRAGLAKPDPGIFLHAAEELGCAPEKILMVGDSFERDIRPAKSIGMKTAWLRDITSGECPEPALVDLELRRLADLPASLSSFGLGGTLKGGVFAAGRGERLRGETNSFKPLVKVRGRALIDHVLSAMGEAGVSEVTIIINEESTAVRDHVAKFAWPFAVRWIVETTPSSMHSFLRVVETLAADGGEGPFLLSTVDTVAAPRSYLEFVRRAHREEAPMTLALSSPGKDPSPLWVRCASNDSGIVALGEAAAGSDLATAGLYFVHASILREAAKARRDNLRALRAFLGRLLERGYRLAGVEIPRSIDVDCPTDVATAEEFLRAMEV